MSTAKDLKEVSGEPTGVEGEVQEALVAEAGGQVAAEVEDVVLGEHAGGHEALEHVAGVQAQHLLDGAPLVVVGRAELEGDVLLAEGRRAGLVEALLGEEGVVDVDEGHALVAGQLTAASAPRSATRTAGSAAGS
jgi:hypothetical protein